MRRKHCFVSLKSKTAISTLFRGGTSYYAEAFLVRYQRAQPEDKKLPPFRVVWAVSKKAGGAVVRNRIKRKLREAFFMALKDLDLHQADYTTFDIAVLPGKKFFSYRQGQLEKQFSSFIRRVQYEK